MLDGTRRVIGELYLAKIVSKRSLRKSEPKPEAGWLMLVGLILGLLVPFTIRYIVSF